MLRPIFVTLGTLLTLGFLLGANPSHLTQLENDKDALVRGLEVYHASYCGSCHALTVANTQGQFGPSHDHLQEIVRKRLADGSYKGKAKTVAAYLRESILEPDAYLAPEYAGSRYRMPAFTDLSDEELDVLTALLDQPNTLETH